MPPDEVALLKADLVALNRQMRQMAGLFASKASFFDVFLKLVDLPPGMDPGKVPGARKAARDFGDFLDGFLFGTRERRSLFADVGSRVATLLEAIQKASK